MPAKIFRRLLYKAPKYGKNIRISAKGESHMKRFFGMLAALAAAVAAVNIYSTGQKLSALENSVIRLHIRANSDSIGDQTLKLRLRDAVLPHAQEWLAGCETQEARVSAMQQRLPEIQTLAEEILRAQGSEQTVTADFAVTEFPSRTYGQYTLPAGEYQSLILTLGAGEGQNWWCLMYPALCIPASSGTQPAELPEDAEALATDPERYEIRLKCVDLCRSAAERLSEVWEQAEQSDWFQAFQRAFG
jgi:stage II sporulation protein R